jgi:hypothetical protein
MLEKMRNMFLITAFCLVSTFAVNEHSRNNDSFESSIHEEVQLLGLTILGQKRHGASTRYIQDERLFGPYLTDAYVKMQFTNSEGIQVIGKSMRYNVESNAFEILVGDQVTYLSGNTVNQFEFLNATGKKRLFVNAKNFSSKDERINGFFEVLEIGRIGLLAHDRIVNKKVYSDNGEGLQSANRQVVETDYFLSKNIDLIPISSFNKRAMEVFGKYSEDLRQFIKEKKLKFKRESDLITLARFYADLIL